MMQTSTKANKEGMVRSNWKIYFKGTTKDFANGCDGGWVK